MTSRQKTFDMCLKEMFRRVGRKVDENFIRQDRWYMQSSWSSREEANFRSWMVGVIRRRHKWPMKMAEKEVSFFLLNYSWRWVPDGCMKVVGGRIRK